MAKFFETDTFESLEALVKVLGFSEDPNYADWAGQRQFDKERFNLFIDTDGSFRLYKDGKSVASGQVPDDIHKVIDASKEDIYNTEDWLASRVTAAATYRRLANERMEAARKEHSKMCSLEASLTRSLHDLQKTKKIAEEGHQ